MNRGVSNETNRYKKKAKKKNIKKPLNRREKEMRRYSIVHRSIIHFIIKNNINFTHLVQWEFLFFFRLQFN
jgi:hypothetical protein